MFRSVILSSLIVLISLSAFGQRRKPVLIDELNKLPGYHIPSSSKAVFIIADNSCLNCNQAFSNTLAKYLARPDVSFVISASPSRLDLSPYISKRRQNVYIDQDQTLTTGSFIKASTVIFFKKNQDVDTVIEIRSDNLQQQFSYLKSKLPFLNTRGSFLCTWGGFLNR